MDTLMFPIAASRFELRFAAAGPNGHDCAFPCDERGRVDMDALNEHDRIEYLFARAVVGRDLARPVVVVVP
jgi:hypothetical protein